MRSDADLSLEEAFCLVHRAYAYLADQGPDTSATRSLLLRVRQNDPAALLLCVRKLLEEQDEVRRALADREGRAALVGEVRQSLYWAMVLAVGRGVVAEEIEFGRFVSAGQEGREPGKGEYGEDAVAILRRALVTAGRALAAFNRGGSERIEPGELALAELREMRGRAYLAEFLGP